MANRWSTNPVCRVGKEPSRERVWLAEMTRRKVVTYILIKPEAETYAMYLCEPFRRAKLARGSALCQPCPFG